MECEQGGEKRERAPLIGYRPYIPLTFYDVKSEEIDEVDTADDGPPSTPFKDTIQAEVLKIAQGEGRERDSPAETRPHIPLTFDDVEYEDGDDPAEADNGSPTTPLLILIVTQVANAGQISPSQSGHALKIRRVVTNIQRGLNLLIAIQVVNSGEMCHSKTCQSLETRKAVISGQIIVIK